ncbi:MAG: HYR domain-containing protein, partial [Flavobacteriales bacterium]
MNWNPPAGADNCPGFSVARTAGPVQGSTFAVQSTTTITYEVTDATGNTADCSFTVTVEDNDFPLVACPADQNVTFPGCSYTVPDYLGSGQVTRTDNCSPLTEAQTPAASTVITAATTVQISIEDPSGNETICAFDINPLDNTPPTFDACPTDTVWITVDNSCQFFMPDYSSLDVSDVCNPTFSFSQSPAPGLPLSAVTPVTVTVSDGTNSTNCLFDVAPIDGTAPSIICPADESVSVNASCQVILSDYTGSASTSDNCDASVAVSQSPTGTVTGNTTVTLTATDDAGNTSTCQFEVEAEDTTDPSISCPATTTAYYNASCLYSMEDLTGLATGLGDNCSDNVDLVLSQIPVLGTSIGVNATVELVVEDEAGNTNSCTLSLVLQDTVSPNVVCPVDQTASVDAGCDISLADYTSLVTASDNCPGLNTVTVVQSPAAATSYDMNSNATVAITMTASDGTNSSTCTFNVILEDNIDPVLTCPNPPTVTANANCEFTMTNFVASMPGSDNCDASLTYSQVPAQGSLVQGNTLVTLYGEDDAGNIGECSFTLTVEDNSNPTITCPVAQSQIADGSCEFVLDSYGFLATADDNCDDNLTITQSPLAGTTQTGDLTVTLTATDDANNFATCTFSVELIDLTPPSITCPSDTIVDFGSGCTFVLDDYLGDETVDDNCDATVSVGQSPASGTTHSGTVTVTLTASDDDENQTTCEFDVIPEDNTDPTITCPGDQVVSSSIVGGNCIFIIPDLTGSATAADNCDPTPTVTQAPGVGNTITANTTITLTVEDNNSNTSTCTFDLILNDDADPSITCPGDLNVAVNTACAYEILDYTAMAVATDNCSTDPTVSQGTTPTIGSTIAAGTTVTITLTAEDDSSNTDVCTFDITAFDETAPTVTCPSPTTVSTNTNCLVFLADYTSGGSSVDNCDGTSLTITQSPVAGTAIGGTTVVTLSVTDNSGNLGICTFNVELDDTTPPSIVCPADQTVASDASCAYSLADYTTFGTVDDNCDLSPVVTQAPAASSSVSATTVVTLTATDASNNMSSCMFNVVAEDVIAPMISACPMNDTVDVAANCTYIMGDYTGDPTYTDNCDAPGNLSVTQAPLAGSLIGGNTVVTISVEDQAGNIATCTLTVVPEDNDPPTIFDCPTDITVDNDPGLCGAVVTWGTITALDNCAGVVVPQLDHGLASGSIFDVATTEVEFIAYDGNGNQTSCVFNVTVNDTEDPVV